MIPSLSPFDPPEARCVDLHSLRDWVPQGMRQRLELSRAWAIIRNQYCAALVGRGVCPENCAMCRAAILEIFAMKEPVGNPEAVLTFRAKEISARVIEERLAAEHNFHARESQQSAFQSLFARAPENPFLELKKFYEAEAEKRRKCSS